MTQSFTYHATTEQETALLGAALADALPPGSVVSLIGTLGAGKTRLVQAVAERLGVDRRRIVSPTFVLIQEYQGIRPVYHFDAYRLADSDEFLALGAEEYFDGNGVSLVEWADRVEDCLPRDRVEVRIEVTGETSRRFEISSLGDSCVEVIRKLAKQFPAT